MPLVVADRVRETTTTTGTGTITLAGAVTGYQSFSAIGNGNTTYYTINAGSQWEVGIGTYLGAGPTLSRDTVLESSNSGSLVNFSAGTKDVFVTYPAEKSISDGYGLLPVANGGTGQTSYTNGQLLIGNSTGNTLTKATLTAGTNISITNGSGAITINATDQYAGTVTSVNVSGGTTGLTTSGGPITSSGTITFAGTLNVANGGTGATSLTSGYLVKGNGTSAASASVVYDDGTNVGIGTASPASKLQLSGAAAGGAIQGTITNTDATGFTGFSFTDGTNVKGQFWVGNGSYGSFGGAGSINISANSGPHVWYTNYSERMRIDSSGNVGIGTSSPVRPLHVFYNSSVVGAYTAVLQGAGGGYGAGVSFQSVLTGGSLAEMARITADGESSWNTTASTQDAGLRFYTALDGTVAEKMRLNSDGNVGVGTSAPASKLEVTGDITQTWAASADRFVGSKFSTTYELGLHFLEATRETRIVSKAADSSGLVSIYTGVTPTERMRIDSSGNVGIGTSSPDIFGRSYTRTVGINSSGTTMLQINGTTYGGIDFGFNGTRTGNILAETGGFYLQTVGAVPMVFTTNGSERFRITSTGGITSSDLADAVGYKGLPQNQQTSAYTLVLADQGDHIYATAGAFAITIPANATTAFPIGTAITIIVEDAGKTVVPASGVTLILAGTGAATTGTRTMAIGSVATIIKVGTNRWYISGSGVT